MTFSDRIWAVTGNNVPAEYARLAQRAATRNGNGVVELGDLRVKPTEVASDSVIITDGAGVARGREQLWQGSYGFVNIGDEPVPVPANTAASVAYRLLCARIEDPTFDGSPWTGSPAEQVAFPRVITTGINASTVDVPDGVTGVPLALITMPANTATITDSMITDLRHMVDPREQAQTFSLQGVWENADAVGNTSTWEQFPNGANWLIDVPEWAAQAVINVTMYGLQYMKSGGSQSGDTDAQSWFRAGLGTTYTGQSGTWVRGQAEYSRITVGLAGTIEVGQAMRGTPQYLTVYGRGVQGHKGSLEADGYASLVATISFRERPRNDVPNRRPA